MDLNRELAPEPVNSKLRPFAPGRRRLAEHPHASVVGPFHCRPVSRCIPHKPLASDVRATKPVPCQNQARDAFSVDKGYYKSEEIVSCENDDITVTLPKPKTSNAKADGRFDRSAFIYEAEMGMFISPAGQHLTYRMTRKKGGKILHRYWPTACGTSPVEHHCTPSKERCISRWEHQEVLERMQQRLEDNPDKMATRRETRFAQSTVVCQYDEAGNWTSMLSDEDAASIDVSYVDYLTGPAGAITVHNARALH